MLKSRRSFLKMGGALLALTLVPLRVLAEFVRPEKALVAKDLDSTFAALGGKPEISDKVKLESPDIAENGAVVPVQVKSEIPGTTKIYIMVEKNPNPLAAAYAIPAGTQPDISTRVKVSETGNVYGVVEAGGKLYMAERVTKVTLGGCGG